MKQRIGGRNVPADQRENAAFPLPFCPDTAQPTSLRRFEGTKGDVLYSEFSSKEGKVVKKRADAQTASALFHYSPIVYRWTLPVMPWDTPYCLTPLEKVEMQVKCRCPDITATTGESAAVTRSRRR